MKKLKISLAMGGGTSMVTFSGAALTEALKLLLLYCQDEHGNDYAGIEVDCMSGASAGAISLAIMLRALMDYKSVYVKAGYETVARIVQDLDRQYPNSGVPRLPFDKREDLIALQVAQKLQEKIWVDKLNIDDLFGDDKKKKYDENKAFGLLPRDYIAELVKTYMQEGVDQIEGEGVRVLNKERVLYACSLTNLTPVKLPAVDRRLNNVGTQDFSYVKNLLTHIEQMGHI